MIVILGTAARHGGHDDTVGQGEWTHCEWGKEVWVLGHDDGGGVRGREGGDGERGMRGVGEDVGKKLRTRGMEGSGVAGV